MSMTDRIFGTTCLYTVLVLTLGACGGNGVTTDGATAGTTTTTTGPGTTATTTGPGTAADTTATTGPGTTPGTTTAEPATTGGATESAAVRVVHLSSDSPTIDIYANGDFRRPVVDALAQRNAASLTLPAGEYAFSITADDVSPDQAVIEVPAQRYEAGKAYTVVALGKLVDRSFEVVRFEDDPASIDPAQVRLQITHAAAAADLAQVDVWTGPRTDMLTLLHADLSFKDSRATDVPGSDFVLAVDTNDDERPDVHWDVFGADLAPHLGGLVQVFVYSDAQDRPSLQVVTGDGPARQIDPE